MVSPVFSVRLSCFHAYYSSFTHRQHSVWAIALAHVSNRNLLCFQEKLVSGVFNNNVLHVSNFVQSSLILSQKGIYVSYVCTPYLTQTLMTLKGSICTFSELHCLGRECQYCQSCCKMWYKNFLVERLFIAVSFNRVAVYLKFSLLTMEKLWRDASFWLNHSTFYIFYIAKCNVTSSFMSIGTNRERFFRAFMLCGRLRKALWTCLSLTNMGS